LKRGGGTTVAFLCYAGERLTVPEAEAAEEKKATAAQETAAAEGKKATAAQEAVAVGEKGGEKRMAAAQEAEAVRWEGEQMLQREGQRGHLGAPSFHGRHPLFKKD
jgi:hypothetical protein